MKIKSIFLASFFCVSALAAADVFAVYDSTVSCDAHTSATNVAPPPRRSDRETGGHDRKSRRARLKPQRGGEELRGDSATLSVRYANPSAGDSAAVNKLRR